jgi:hypothetical protein
MADTFETQGTKFQRGDGASPEVFTDIPLLTRIAGAGTSRNLIDTTNLQSTSREYRMALKDGREMSLDMQYDPDDLQQAGLKSDSDAGTRRHFKMILTDTSPAEQWTFTGLVTDWNLDVDIDNVYILHVTIKPTGDLLIS